ncbi:MAG: hypothetical protein M1825_006279 [Sarcosagium campestre]|nr:MAG: hypothetical protein M1825_006279 [Sarcosagium campestre]
MSTSDTLSPWTMTRSTPSGVNGQVATDANPSFVRPQLPTISNVATSPLGTSGTLQHTASTPAPMAHFLLPRRDMMASAANSTAPVPSSQRTVIDLTLDDSPPRQREPSRVSRTSTSVLPTIAAQDVIDVDALPDQPSDDDVEFSYSRVRPRRPERPVGAAVPAQPIEPQPIGDMFGRLGGPAQMLWMHHQSGNGRGSLWRDVMATYFTRDNHAVPVQAGARSRDGAARADTVNAAVQGNLGLNFDRFENPIVDIETFEAPRMNYNVVALDNEAANITPPPKYEAPPAPTEGFVRSPGEDDVVVCPNCDDELGVGSTEEKRSVWFVKGCGHVYCGSCAKNRSASRHRSNNRKDLAKPFKECLVCRKSVSAPSTMKQIYL